MGSILEDEEPVPKPVPQKRPLTLATLLLQEQSQSESEDDEGENDAGDGVKKPKKKNPSEPRTKAELYAQFKGKGPVAMVKAFLQGRRLQYLAIIICQAPSDSKVSPCCRERERERERERRCRAVPNHHHMPGFIFQSQPPGV